MRSDDTRRRVVTACVAVVSFGYSLASLAYRLSGHPESSQLEKAGVRTYVNVPSSHSVEIVDRVKGEVVAT